MRFLIDAQLPQRLARRLGELGHDAIHVADIGLGSASDAAVWNAAMARAAILVTKDQDLAHRARGSRRRSSNCMDQNWQFVERCPDSAAGRFD